MQQDPAAQDNTSVDATRKFVRVIEERGNGLVAFEFSIGWPELAVELVMPRAAFNEFCATHQVHRLDDLSPTERHHDAQAAQDEHDARGQAE